MLQHEPLHNEPRYDAETLRKVTALAQQLKARQQETLSAREIETIGEEVGLERRFMQQALSQVTAHKRETRGISDEARLHRLKALMGGWWAAGWTIPMILVTLTSRLGDLSAAFFFLGWGLYIGLGILLTTLAKTPEEIEDEAQHGSKKHPPHFHGTEAAPAPNRQISRADLLDALFAIQQALELHKQHRAFLSVDVVGSTGMKAGADPLLVEHSFGQFRAWLEEVIRGHAGEMQSAAGDGMMCLFRDEASAIRAARELQIRIGEFNAERNRLGQPFQIRCGITSGTVALEPGVPIGHLNSPILDRAAAIQKRAAPGDIVVGSEVAATALVELGGVAALPELVNGERAFSWRAAHGGLPTGERS